MAAEDGHEAVEKFNQHEIEIDVLLFDVVMPKMTGYDAVEKICVLRPDIGIVFCTGYDPDQHPPESPHDDNVRVVQNPFRPAILINAVRAALDKSQLAVAK